MNVLYENEVYNPEVGQYERLEQQEVDKAIQDGEAIQAMKQTEGWKLIEEFLKGAIEKYKSLLLYEQDLEKIRRLQEAIKSYSNVFHFVEAKEQEYELAKEQSKNKG